MKILVRLYGTLFEVVGAKRVEVELEGGATVKDLARKLAEMYGEMARGELFDPTTGELREFYTFFVNGKLCEPDAALKDGDEVAILPRIAGGSRTNN